MERLEMLTNEPHSGTEIIATESPSELANEGIHPATRYPSGAWYLLGRGASGHS